MYMVLNCQLLKIRVKKMDQIKKNQEIKVNLKQALIYNKSKAISQI